MATLTTIQEWLDELYGDEEHPDVPAKMVPDYLQDGNEWAVEAARRYLRADGTCEQPQWGALSQKARQGVLTRHEVCDFFNIALRMHREGKLRQELSLCPKCRGKGEVDHPAFSNGWTGEDRAADPEGFECYMRGDYDVVCPCCGGKRVVDLDALIDWHVRQAMQREYETEARYGA